MRIEQLEHLAAVTRHGSFRRASEHVHLSQPALSESVRNLERELGVTLLERRRTGTRVTPEGERLLAQVLEVIDAAHRLRRAADVPGPIAPLRVAAGYVDTSGLATAALFALLGGDEATPPVEVRAVDNAQVAEEVLNGSADIGVLLRVLADPLPDCVEVDDLWTGGIDVLIPSSSPLAELEKIGPTDLLDVAVVSELPSSPEPGGADVVWRCCQPDLVNAAVRARVGVGLVPALPRELGPDLATRPLADSARLALSLVRPQPRKRG